MEALVSLKSAFKVSEQIWMDKKNDVRHLKTRPLSGYVAHKENPPQICIVLSNGPDDLGRQRDILIDVKSLVKELVDCGLMAA